MSSAHPGREAFTGGKNIYLNIFTYLTRWRGGGEGLRERGGGDEKWEEGDALSAPPPGGENLNLFEKEI